ncbi:hypothetical protein K491DRAFT_577611, partial [Lophiostoma macrostomum CBS 122681]
FRENKDGIVHITNTDSKTFGLLVQWIMFAYYEDHDDLTNHRIVRNSAKAWVLGDYLVAPGFKNYAMLQLYNIYHPKDGSAPKSGICPATIKHCCSHSPVNSPLRNLYFDIMLELFKDKTVVNYSDKLRQEWDEVWELHRDFSNDLM